MLQEEEIASFISRIELSSDEFDSKIGFLSALVVQSAQSKDTRDDLRKHTLKLEQLLVPSSDEVPHLRLVRGILLVIRNIVTEPNDFEIPRIIQSLGRFLSIVDNSNEMFDKTLTVYYQILANITQLKPNAKISDILPFLSFKEKSNRLALVVTLCNLLVLEDNVYDLLKSDDVIAVELTDFEVTDDPNEEEMLYIKIWQHLIVHESFGKWFAQNKLLKVLKICQLVITLKDDWDNYQLIALLSWLFEFYNDIISKTLIALQEKDYELLKELHPELLIALDCLSELGKFNIAKDFLLNYKIIDTLIPFLRVLHETIEPTNMTKKKTDDFEFPHIKAIIIEILSYLVFENFEMQEAVRELHGIEVILSSCIIDDNNPFIKERAIICLKYLLNRNQKNQDFVASLEAKKQVDSQVLEDVGYKVNINNGNFELNTK